MRRPRQITTAALIAIVAFLCSTAFASASNPLLSGYGGPGAGNQEILGSTLIGGGGSGKGSSGSGGGGAAGTGEAGSSATGSVETPAHTPLGSKRPARRDGGSTGSATEKTGGVSHASKGAGGAYQPSKELRAGSTSDSRTLGLSGDDVLYIILALGLLAATAALTVRLSMRPQRDSSG